MSYAHTPKLINIPNTLYPLFGMSEKQREQHTCPHCAQNTSLQKMKLDRYRIEVLKFIVSKGSEGAKTKEITAGFSRTQSNTFQTMRHWELIEKREKDTWHATQVGIDFLAGTCAVPTVLWVYNKHARLVPDVRMYEGWSTILNIPGYIEADRESKAQESVALDGTGQESLI